MESKRAKRDEEEEAHGDEAQLDLPVVARGTLLPVEDRVARLRQAVPMILAAIEGETDEIAIEACLACLLWQTLIQASWCGFYRRVQDRLLKVGPYQGFFGCIAISFDRGVCGTCARTEKSVLVPNVHEFPGHIACDSKTNSELVVPVFCRSGRLIGVLDLDCLTLDGFSMTEANILEDLLQKAFAHVA